MKAQSIIKQKKDILLSSYGSSIFELKDCDIASVLKTYKLDWAVDKRPLYILDEHKNIIKAENEFAITKIFKNEKGETNYNVLGVAKKDYCVSQNEDLIKIIGHILSQEKKIKIETAGELKNGRLVYIQLKLPQTISVLGDENKCYLTALTSNDATKRIHFGLTTVRIICENTFFQAFQNLKGKISHTKNMTLKIEKASQTLSYISSMLKESEALYIKMAKTKITDQIIKKAMNFALHITPKDVISTRKQNLTAALQACIQKEFNSHPKATNGNLYGLWNGISCFFNHYNIGETKNERREYVMCGGGFIEMNKNFEFIKTLIK